jgi:hypothetical protein
MGVYNGRDCQRPGVHFVGDDPHIFPSCCVASPGLRDDIIYRMDHLRDRVLHVHQMARGWDQVISAADAVELNFSIFEYSFALYVLLHRTSISL